MKTTLYTLPAFLMREALTSPEKKAMLKSLILPKVMPVFFQISQDINREIEKGNVKPFSIMDLVLNIGSLNVASIVISQAFFDSNSEIADAEREAFLKHRKENNIQVIFKSLQK